MEMAKPGANSGDSEDIRELTRQLEAVTQDASDLMAALDGDSGVWRATGESWSVAQCLEHLALTNRAYLDPMQATADVGREEGRFRKRPAMPGVFGRWFAKTMEPPARAPFKSKAPPQIRPGGSLTLAEAYDAFVASHQKVVAFLNENADLDLAGLRFQNPFVRGLRFSLASGLHIIAAHERRHLWQAWETRRSAELSLAAARPAPPAHPQSR
jgi:hypothetical protein